jgi:hypothetical protein
VAGSVAPKRYRGRTVSQHAERIASWILDEWSARRRLGYTEMRDAAMAEFECGRQMAESALVVATDKLRARTEDPGMRSRVVDAYWDLYDRAIAKGDERAAIRVLDSIVGVFGFSKPTEVHHSGSIGVDVTKMSDVELDETINGSNAIVERSLARERAKAARARGEDPQEN